MRDALCAQYRAELWREEKTMADEAIHYAFGDKEKDAVLDRLRGTKNEIDAITVCTNDGRVTVYVLGLRDPKDISEGGIGPNGALEPGVLFDAAEPPKYITHMCSINYLRLAGSGGCWVLSGGRWIRIC
jgi:hypothetical protein